MTTVSNTSGCASPLAAYETHTDFIEWRRSHPDADRLLNFSYWNATNGYTSEPVSLNDREQHFEVARLFHNICQTADDVVLSMADTVYLSKDIHELVAVAAESMPDEVLFRTDAHTPCALMFLEHPIEVEVGASIKASDLDGIVEQVRAVGGTVDGARLNSEPVEGRYNGTDTYVIRAISWADSEYVRDAAVSKVIDRFSETSRDAVTTRFPDDIIIVSLYGNITSSTIDGLTMRAQLPHLPSLPAAMNLIDRFGFAYGEDGYAEDRVIGKVDDRDINAERYRWARRYIVALLRLMNEYVDVETSRAPRAFTRRASRSGRVETSSGITSLALRRGLYESSGVESGRKVTLAHLVRGHWRNQWYPSQQTHRARWIAAHRRGGAPTDDVIETHRVFSVSR